MFGWRRRSEGFEWREHVRTTVLVRRADRQRRIDDARVAALSKVQDVRDRGFEAGKAGVDAAAGLAANAASHAGHGAWAGLVVAGRGVAAAGSGVARGATFAWDVARASVEAAAEYLPRRVVDDASASDTNIVQGSPIDPGARLAERVQREARVRDAALAQLDKRGRREPAERFAAKLTSPPKPALPRSPRPRPQIDTAALQQKITAAFTTTLSPWLGAAGKVAAALALIVFGGQILRGGDNVSDGNGVGATGSISRPVAGGDGDGLSGRATAITGDMLQLNGRDIRLAGIAAPEANQPCLTASGRRWNCQISAKRALERTLRGKSVACEASGEDASGVTFATCKIGDEDVARALVRDGHVFAANSIFSSYKAEEEPARAEKKGLWQGETVHPDTWRERVWEEAKRTAPDGCPIKGVVTSSARTYAMPWSSAYSGSRFRATKAQQWFCSEDDARAAGFKAASNS